MRLAIFLALCAAVQPSLGAVDPQTQSNALNPDPFASGDPTTQATVVLRRDLFVNGEDIRYYAVLVASARVMEPPSSGEWDGDAWPDIRRRGNAETDDGTVLTYQTTPVKWEPFGNGSESVTYTIGTGECDPHGYCNAPLKERYGYALKVRGFTRERYEDTDVVYFQTLEHLPVKFICLVLGGIFMAGALAAAISMVRVDLSSISSSFSMTKLAPSTFVLFQSYTPSEFRKHADNLLNTTGRLSNEFYLLGTLNSNPTTLCLCGQRIDNRNKNRYGDVLPFDVTRVELSVVDGDPSTDYINASYVKGYSQKAEYIVTQGPMKETCRDFYRMILEQKVAVIVMLTELEENGVEVCYKYYPDLESSLTFGDIEVRCLFEKDLDFCIRRRLLIKSPHSETEVTQLHHEDWPDFACPENGDDLISLIEYIRRIQSGGFTVVHGTAGTGRCGTFIALDVLLRGVRNHDKISVFNTVLDMRRQRMNLVQTMDQYAFIYERVLDAVKESSGKGRVVTEL